MDILFDQHLNQNQLNDFFQEEFPNHSWRLVEENDDYWEYLSDCSVIFQSVVNHELSAGFKYGLNIYLPIDAALEIIETLSAHLAANFNCATLCDASRVVLKPTNIYYSLLFEKSQVFLVDDYDVEDTGLVTKIVELNCSSPGYGTLS